MRVNVGVICGGSGTRLWPLSRTKTPKQLLCLCNNKSILQNTIIRFTKLIDHGIKINKFIILCSKDYIFQIKNQIQELNINCPVMYIAEPNGRDTAPAIAISTLLATAYDITIITPCDHIFNDIELCKSIKCAMSYVANSIITIGIKPTYPETGYGYINVDNNLRTLQFIEKPDYETSVKYINEYKYLWNAGIFIFKNENMIKCFNEYANDILDVCKETLNKSNLNNDTFTLDSEYDKCRKISIDYAIMEKLSQSSIKIVDMRTIPYNYEWYDIGSFKSLADYLPKNNENNIIDGNIVTIDTNNCYIKSDNQMIATIGIKNLAIVSTSDALLICDKERCQDTKEIIKKIEISNNNKILHEHIKVMHPWGWYNSTEGNDHSGYKVKHICVYPNKKLSLQSHKHRNKHWVIIKGRARAQVGNNITEMNENQHVYIPIGEIHGIENIGNNALEFIETQIGDYLGEDNTVRYQDDFGHDDGMNY